MGNQPDMILHRAKEYLLYYVRLCKGRVKHSDTKPWVDYRSYRPNANASGTLREHPYKYTQPMLPDTILYNVILGGLSHLRMKTLRLTKNYSRKCESPY